MADVKSTGKYDYMKPDNNNERRKKVEPAGQHDTEFETCATMSFSALENL